MSFRLPTIESKNKLPEDEEYNFVNKDKKKSAKDVKEPSGLVTI